MNTRIFKLEAVHEFNKPLIVKVWSDKILENLNINGVLIERQKSEIIDDKRCITYFCSNKNYKAQLKNALIDFIAIGCKFQAGLFG